MSKEAKVYKQDLEITHKLGAGWVVNGPSRDMNETTLSTFNGLLVVQCHACGQVVLAKFPSLEAVKPNKL